MKFPAHYPQLCPPATALDVNGDLYRFVSNDPPKATDFISYHLLGKAYANDKHCQACGLSVLRNEADVEYWRKLTPSLRKQYVAKGNVTSDWGTIAQTGSIPHHTWWFPEDKKPETIFAVVTIS
jgi:hypothetical protein